MKKEIPEVMKREEKVKVEKQVVQQQVRGR